VPWGVRNPGDRSLFFPAAFFSSLVLLVHQLEDEQLVYFDQYRQPEKIFDTEPFDLVDHFGEPVEADAKVTGDHGLGDRVEQFDQCFDMPAGNELVDRFVSSVLGHFHKERAGSLIGT
jgi:hypothetical protein